MNFFAPTIHAGEFDSAPMLELADYIEDRDELEWYVVNDNVMGGRSRGGFIVDHGELRFAGSTNTRGGGFSSIRTRNLELDLSNYEGIRLNVRGDGRRYTWRITTDARWRGREVGYWSEFDTDDKGWSTVDIPFSNFLPQFRGTPLDGPMLEPSRITGMGLMIYDKLDGPFELRLSSVHAYSAAAPFALEQYRWRKRVLVVSAEDSDDMKLKELQTELASLPGEFADRDMELVVLLNRGVSVAGHRELTTAEATEARVKLGIEAPGHTLHLIGKDGSVKLSTESSTTISEIFAYVDTMPMRQSEMSDSRDH